MKEESKKFRNMTGQLSFQTMLQKCASVAMSGTARHTVRCTEHPQGIDVSGCLLMGLSELDTPAMCEAGMSYTDQTYQHDIVMRYGVFVVIGLMAFLLICFKLFRS